MRGEIIDKELLNDLFVTAIEGGINYWADVTAYKSSIDDWFATIETEDVTETESMMGFDRSTLRIDEKTILKGIKLFAKETDSDRENKNIHPDSDHANLSRLCVQLLNPYGPVTELDFFDYDCLDADMVVQMGLFGEVIYG